MVLILIIVLLILLLGGGVYSNPTWQTPQIGGGVFGAVLLILLIFWLIRNLRVGR